jgi:hypothetical protein
MEARAANMKQLLLYNNTELEVGYCYVLEPHNKLDESSFSLQISKMLEDLTCAACYT